jgi:hypothetical protein
VQGFNFLVPADAVHDFCGMIGLTPNPDTRLMKEWEQGVAAYFGGEYQRSLEHLNNAERIMPGFPDIQRLRAYVQMRVDKHPRFIQRGQTVGLGVGIILAGFLVIVGAKRYANARANGSPAAVQRIGADEIRRRLETGTGVALVDARHGAALDMSPVQAAGAMHFDIDHPDVEALRVHVKPDGEVIAYCT